MPALELYLEYSRKDVHDIFSPETPFTPSNGTWGLHGIVDIPKKPGDYVFFVTFGQHQADHIFDEWITEEGVISWQSQPRQSFDDRRIKEFIHHNYKRNLIHLFLRTQRTTNYTYLGKLGYLIHDPKHEKPVYIYWQLLDWPIPVIVLNRINLHLQPANIYRQVTSQINESTDAHNEGDIPLIWQGRTWQVNRQTLIAQVKDWIVRGLPEEAIRYKDWYIDIDGQPVSPKWLFHLITDAGYNEFDSPLAREKLSKMGFVSLRVQPTDKLNANHQIADIHAQQPSIQTRRKAISNKSEQPQIQILDTRLDSIHQVLSGLIATPSDEVLCDWIHFCYDFGLYKEGQELFTFVSSEHVNPWYYERTKKLARLCLMRSVSKD